MTKKQNSIVFIIVGTIANVLFSLLGILLIIFIGVKLFPAEYINVVIPIAFIGGIFLGMFSYQKLANFVIKKFNLEEHLDPILTKRKKKY